MANSKSNRQFSGIRRDQAVNFEKRIDDHRTFLAKMHDWTLTSNGTIAIFSSLAASAFLLSWAPFLPDLLLLFGIIIYFSYYHRRKKYKWALPFRVPSYLNKYMGHKVLDASTGEAAEANLYLGRDEETSEEVWINLKQDINKHMLIIGTTGSGKTEAILGIIFGFVARDSGSLFIDGKASVDTFNSIYKISRLLGRDCDLFAIDYLTGGKDMKGVQRDKRSHTYNPLKNGSAAQKSEIMGALLDGDPKEFWTARAISLMEGTMEIVTFLADRNFIILNADTLAQFVTFDNLENIYHFGIFTDLHGELINLKSEEYKTVWAEMASRFNSIQKYFDNLPSYSMCVPTVPNKPMKISLEQFSQLKYPEPEKDPKPAANKEAARQKATEQHGYLGMQFVRALNNLSDGFGHIYGAELGEIDYSDLVLNRRILVVFLPALERNEANLTQLGKLSVLSLKAVLGSLVNSDAEGERRKIVDGNPSKSKYPFAAVLDEIGSYIVKGISVIPAQARSLGVAVIFGTQSIDDLDKADKGEGSAIKDNSALKMFGRLTSESNSRTADTAISSSGKVHVQVADEAYYEKAMLGTGGVKIGDSSRLQEISVASFKDLVAQENGQFHAMMGMSYYNRFNKKFNTQRVVRLLSFYTGNIPNVESWRKNGFVEVKPLSKGSYKTLALNETAHRYLKLGLNDALEKPSQRLISSFTKVSKTSLGQFLEFRRAQIAQQIWPTEAEEREKLINEWFRRKAITALIERDSKNINGSFISIANSIADEEDGMSSIQHEYGLDVLNNYINRSKDKSIELLRKRRLAMNFVSLGHDDNSVNNPPNYENDNSDRNSLQSKIANAASFIN